MKNKYAICEWYLALSGPAAIKTASRIGFDGIQISDLQGYKGGFPLNDPRIQELYAEASEETGIVIQAFNPGTSVMAHGGICHPADSSMGQEVLYNFRKSLDVCKALSIPVIMIPGLDASRVNNEYQYRNTCVMLNNFIDEASEKGITVTYESFLTTDRLIDLIERTGGRIRLTFDTLNPIRYGTADPSEELRRIGADIIDHVHIKDAYENLVGTCPLGKGEGRLSETLTTLQNIGYSGWYAAESFYYMPPMTELGSGWDLAAADLKYMHENI